MAASPARERSPGAAPNTGGPNATVYVGNLSGDTERDQLREAMTTFGRVATATVRAATQKPSACPAALFCTAKRGVARPDARAAAGAAQVLWDRENNRSRGYGFVTFEDPADAEDALRAGNVTVDGRAARIGTARQRALSGPGGPNSGGRGRWGEEDNDGPRGRYDGGSPPRRGWRERRSRSPGRGRGSRSRTRSRSPGSGQRRSRSRERRRSGSPPRQPRRAALAARAAAAFEAPQQDGGAGAGGAEHAGATAAANAAASAAAAALAVRDGHGELSAKLTALEALLERRSRGEEAAARRASDAESRAEAARADAAAMGAALRRLVAAHARAAAGREELARAEVALRRAADDAAAVVGAPPPSAAGKELGGGGGGGNDAVALYANGGGGAPQLGGPPQQAPAGDSAGGWQGWRQV